jgi:hypothetical protein
MRVALLGPDDPGWREALDALAHDVFHRPDYLAGEAARIGGTAHAVHVADGERRFFLPWVLRDCAGLFPEGTPPHRDATSPHGYAGMLLSPAAAHDPAFVAQAFEASREALAGLGAVSAFLRMHPLLNDSQAGLLPAGTHADLGDSVVVDLSADEATLEADIRDKHREARRRCERRGYAARFAPLAPEVAAVAAIYADTMDRVDAREAYRFPLAYFEWLAARPDVHACIVGHAGEPAAACVILEHAGIVHAHLGGTRSAHLKNSPFLLALYDLVFWAKRRGNRWLHLGGGVGGADDSLMHFKAGFSPGRRRLFAARLVVDPARYRHLVALREQRLGRADALRDTPFFPAYRAA